MSGFVHIDCGVDIQQNDGGLSCGIVSYGKLYGLARGNGEGRAAPFEVGVNFSAVHRRGQVAGVGVVNGDFARDIEPHDSGVRAFVFDVAFKGVPAGGGKHYVDVYVLVAAARKIAVFNGKRAFRLCNGVDVGVALNGSVAEIENGFTFRNGNVFAGGDVARTHRARPYVFIDGAFTLFGAGVFAHPAFRVLVARPVVHKNLCRGEGKRIFFGKEYLVHGFVVDEPGYVGRGAAEAVFVEFLGSVKAELVHIFVPALTVDEVVELNFRGIFAEELDIDFVVRVAHAVAVGIVVFARADEERACRTLLCRRLHADDIVAVAVVLIGFDLARIVFAVSLGHSEAKHAVIHNDVFLCPGNVEHAAVAVTVGSGVVRRKLFARKAYFVVVGKLFVVKLHTLAAVVAGTTDCERKRERQQSRSR